MTPEQEARFHLVNTQDSTMGTPVEMAPGVRAQSVDMDEISQGLSQSVEYMAKNGPVRPVQKVPARVMTQHQLEEQRMNEAQGLPSNLNEASRVVALEQTVANLNDNMGKIVELLSRKEQTPQPSNAPATVVQGGQTYYPHPHPTERHCELRPTPPERPAVPQPVPTSFKQLVKESQLDPPSALLAQVMGHPTPESVPPTSPPDSSQQPSQPPASPETTTEILSDQDIQDFTQAAFPPGGPVRPISVTMGPTGSQGVGDINDRYELTEELSPGEVVAVAEEPEPSPEDLVEVKRLSRQQMLTEQVTNWLKSKDTHKFWRQFLAGACNKNLSYNTWPPEFQGPFDVKFKEMIADSSFVSTLCGRITKMQMGHLVAPHVAGAFVVVTAGFLSFALLDQ